MTGRSVSALYAHCNVINVSPDSESTFANVVGFVGKSATAASSSSLKSEEPNSLIA